MGLAAEASTFAVERLLVLNHNSFTHGFVSGFDWHGPFLLNCSLHGGS